MNVKVDIDGDDAEVAAQGSIDVMSLDLGTEGKDEIMGDIKGESVGKKGDISRPPLLRKGDTFTFDVGRGVGAEGLRCRWRWLHNFTLVVG